MMIAALLDLIITLVGTLALAAIYSGIILVLVRLCSRLPGADWLDRHSQNKRRFWRRSMWLLFTISFFFSFTYWGDKGMGEIRRFPIGYSHAVECNDGEWTYITTADHKKIPIGTFITNDTTLFATSDAGRYIIFDLPSGTSQQFEDLTSYELYAKQHNLPPASSFKNFSDQCHAHWLGWRAFVIP